MQKLMTAVLTIGALCLTWCSGSCQDQEPNQTDPNSSDWVNRLPANQALPDNTFHRSFSSELLGQLIGYCIYLPPSYETSKDRQFPVIYNLHGYGGNEFTSLDSIELLHEGIVEGRWPEMIMVLPNGGRSSYYKDSADGRVPMESILLTELIPYIDSNYRTIEGRQGRCLEGFSMGGRGSIRLAMKHPDLFCSVFCQAGKVPRLLKLFDSLEPAQRAKQLLGSDRTRWENNDVYRVTSRNADRIRGRVRIRIVCGTKDPHLSSLRDFHQHLSQLKLDHTYIELEGLAHDRTKMIDTLRSGWFDYHVESLKLAQRVVENGNGE